IWAIVEHEDVTCALQTCWNPMYVVLEEKLLLGGTASAVSAWVAPPVNQVTALAIFAALVNRCLRCRGAVVNDPEFAEAMHADHDLIKFGMVGKAIEMVPIGAFAAAGPALARTVLAFARVVLA